MDVEFAFICRSARWERGRPRAEGIGRHVLEKAEGSLSIVCQLQFTRGDDGVSEIDVSLVDPDELTVARKALTVGVPFPDSIDEPFGYLAFIGEFEDLHFEKNGPYAIRISIGDRNLMSVPFEVV